MPDLDSMLHPYTGLKPGRADFLGEVAARVAPSPAPVHVGQEAMTVRLILPPQGCQQGGEVVLIPKAVPPPVRRQHVLSTILLLASEA